MQLGNAFSPIHIYGAHVRIVAYDFFDTASDFPKFFRLRPHHPKSNWEGRVGSKYQLSRPNPRFLRQAVGGRLAQAQFETIPCLHILGQNHNFGEGGIGQLRVVGKEKPWSTRSDIGCHDFRFGLLRQPVFDLFCRCAGRLDAGAQWKLDLNQQFWPVRVWKKLFLHDSHPSARHYKRPHYNAGYRIFFPHAPTDKTAKPLVSRSGIDPRMASFYGFDLGKKFYPQIWRENHRYDPRGNQRESDNPEDVSGIFSRGRTRKADRQKPDYGYQRPGKHWRCGVAPGISRGSDAIHSLFHLHHHGFNSDDGIIHQEPQRDDERSQCDSIKNPIRDHHDHKYRAQCQRDCRHHDDSNSPPQAQQADQHYYADRHRELDHKFVYRRADIDGLIGNFFQADSQWQAGGDLVAFRPQGFA